MSSEMTTLLDRATPDAVEPLDYRHLVQKGRRRKRTKQAAGAITVAAGAIAVTTVALAGQNPAAPEVASGSDGLAGSCTVIEVDVLGDRTVGGLTIGALSHFEAGDPAAPSAEELYINGRPTASGPHYDNFAWVSDSVATDQLDERAVTHNLEHGAVAIWFDPDQVTFRDLEEMEAMLADLHVAGFVQRDVGAGVFASPYTDPGIDSGAAVALRAWGMATDCTAWNAAAARQFVTEHYGSKGVAPEGHLAPHPGR